MGQKLPFSCGVPAIVGPVYSPLSTVISAFHELKHTFYLNFCSKWNFGDLESFLVSCIRERSVLSAVNVAVWCAGNCGSQLLLWAPGSPILWPSGPFLLRGVPSTTCPRNAEHPVTLVLCAACHMKAADLTFCL